jgi:L-lactate utilization protein LutB
MGMGNPVAERNALLGAALVKNLEKRGFAAYYCADKAAALAKALELIPKDHVVSWGGCASVDEIGLKDKVKAEYKTLDRDKAKSPEERVAIMRQGLLADTFLMGANAITEAGDLFDIDANGNRCAALIFGPKQVIVVAGMNKVVKDEMSAYHRMRSVAAPINVQRFPSVKTPCKLNGSCADCLAPDCCCNYIVRVRRSQPQGKIKVILVGENLGY